MAEVAAIDGHAVAAEAQIGKRSGDGVGVKGNAGGIEAVGAAVNHPIYLLAAALIAQAHRHRLGAGWRAIQEGDDEA